MPECRQSGRVSIGALNGLQHSLRRRVLSEPTAIPKTFRHPYPALYRLEHQGLIASEWGESENKRKAKYYCLTVAGRRQLHQEARDWNRMADIIAGILDTARGEL